MLSESVREDRFDRVVPPRAGWTANGAQRRPGGAGRPPPGRAPPPLGPKLGNAGAGVEITSKLR